LKDKIDRGPALHESLALSRGRGCGMLPPAQERLPTVVQLTDENLQGVPQDVLSRH